MDLFRDSADVSVRPSVPGDDAAITRVQLRAWRANHAGVLGADALEAVDAAAVRAGWAAAIDAPPSPAHRVLVACDGPFVVGFAACVPDADNDDVGVEVSALEVDPDHWRAGHGSRLLAACVDLARADGARHVRTWVLDGDTAREQFLTGAGLGPDGARRELAVSADGADGAESAESAHGVEGAVAEHRWGAEI